MEDRRGLKRPGDFQAEFLSSTEDISIVEDDSKVDIKPNDGIKLVDALEKNFQENRADLLSDDGIICTPLKVLKDLAFQYGVPVEATTFEVHLPNDVYMFDAIRNRVALNVGPFTGHGESNRHRMAVQLAAADLLEQLKKERKETKIDGYGLLPGCRTNPMIYEDLRELCRLEKLSGMPVYTQLNSACVHGSAMFAFRCAIGQLESIGSSDSIFLAKRLAAKAMYEQLTNETYPDDHVAAGKACLSEDDFKAMGINPILSARVKERNEREDDALSKSNSNEPDGKRPSEFTSEDIHDDDFAEEDDNIIMMQQQLSSLDVGGSDLDTGDEFE